MTNSKYRISNEEFVERYSKEELEFLKACKDLMSDEDFQRDFEAIKKSNE